MGVVDAHDQPNRQGQGNAQDGQEEHQYPWFHGDEDTRPRAGMVIDNIEGSIDLFN
jgi:hypothetical protein